MKIEICPTCGKEYTLGKDGTVHGCDKCNGVIRDRNGMILEFIKPEVKDVKVRMGVRHKT
jgi:hypothetical protein